MFTVVGADRNGLGEAPPSSRPSTVCASGDLETSARVIGAGFGEDELTSCAGTLGTNACCRSIDIGGGDTATVHWAGGLATGVTPDSCFEGKGCECTTFDGTGDGDARTARGGSSATFGGATFGGGLHGGGGGNGGLGGGGGGGDGGETSQYRQAAPSSSLASADFQQSGPST